MTRVVRKTWPLLLFLVLIAAHGVDVAAKEPTDKQRIATFKKTLKSKDPKTRARAFEHLRGVKTGAGIEAVIWGVKRLAADDADIHDAQVEAEALYEKCINDLKAADDEYQSSPQSSRDLDRYNKRERKISKMRDAQIKRLKNLENDFTRSRASLQQAMLIAGDILDVLTDEDLALALARLNDLWLHSKNIDDQLRWVDTVGDVERLVVVETLHAVVGKEDVPLQVRTAVIEALAARRDGWVLGKSIEFLALPPDQDGLIVAAIAAIRRMHDKRGIEPLIKHLQREDIKRTRGDACKALMSLTAQDHGAYAGEWRKWWLDAKADFVLPKDPKPPGPTRKRDKGGTFYGIHTFSDRVLFVIDISGSMDRQQKGKDAAGKTKMQVCKEQLTGFVYNLNDGDTFNVILFNHQVIPWQSKKQVARHATKKMLAKWIEAEAPEGGTNIFDALERAFMMAVFGTTGAKQAVYDTIFFLTDGKPTAGKIMKPERILEVLREWNKTAKLTIHCVGIGKDHDVEFMRALAEIGDGEYRAH